VTAAELEQQMIELNGKYSKIPFQQWREQMQELSDQALELWKD
jgi:hypothetical protein